MMRKKFWEKPLESLDREEWEALCDGCGKCCLNKLEDEDTQEVALTRVACRLLDDSTCRCTHYENRQQFVPDCIVLKPETLDTHAYWMPLTCAYRLLHIGERLPDWHPLLTGNPATTHSAGVSVAGRTVSELTVDDDDWDDHIIDEPI